MAEMQSFRRVLIAADQSADWMVAGLRQLDRLALSIDEFAVENKETAPVVVCILWRPDLDQAQRWVPTNERLTKIAFTTRLEDEPFDLVLNTRLFLYRKAVRSLISQGRACASPITSEAAAFPEIGDVRKHVPASEMELWESYFRLVESYSREGEWEYIADGNKIDQIEIRFLRRSGKSQDGFVSRYLNRPISRVVTRLLLRFPTTPNAWTLLILPLPIAASLILLQGTFWSFLTGLVLFQVFSILDGCDGEIARAKFLESERGRRLDGLCDILSNILLVAGLGFGLFHQAQRAGSSSWFYLVEGLLAAALIGLNEFLLARRESDGRLMASSSLSETLYPRHRELASGLSRLGETFAYWVMQLTKRDVAMLFFVFLAAIGQSAWILHLLFAVTAISLALAWRARSTL